MAKHLCVTGCIVLAVLGAGCNPKQQNQGNAVSTSNVPTANAPVMQFSQMTHDFGNIQEGAVVTHTFAFTNTGKTPLVIENAVASCGCTVPEWPRRPLAPSEKGEIKVEFNSRGKAGPQQKTITVYANTQPRQTVLVMSGIVNAVAQ